MAAAILGRPSCECSFVNLYAWREVYRSVFARIDGRLLVMARNVGILMFPFGARFAPAEMERVRQAASAASGRPLIWGDVPSDYIETHGEALAALYHIDSMDSDEDYLYRTENLAAVKGHCHQNTRRLLRHFEHEVPGSRLEPVSPPDAAALMALALRLQQEHPVDGAEQERVALVCALEHFGELGLEGRKLLDGQGNLLAFSVWSFVTPSVADVHFEKALRHQPGATQAVRIGVARALLGRAEGINLEQDLGVPGLRQSKRSFCPDQMLKRHLLRPRGEGGL